MQRVKNILRTIKLVLSVIFKRLLPIATFAIFFIIIASMIDRGVTQNRPATDYLNYYRFYVPNAREGEDLYFTVCRTHTGNFNYNGNLLIYVQPTSTGKNETKVFTQEIGGTLRPGECEDKVLRDSDFHHSPGKYKMFINVSFREPKYQYEKTASYGSNVYTVYVQPTDVESRIQLLQQQLEQAQQQLRDAQAGASSIGNDLRAPGSATPVSGTPSAQSQPMQQSATPAQPEQQTEPQTREVCTVNLLGIKVGCRQEPV